MLYTIKTGIRKTTAKIETWDGVVTKATPSFRWAIGKDIETVIRWAASKGMTMRVFEGLDFDGSPSSPSLKDLPDDAQIMKRLKS